MEGVLHVFIIASCVVEQTVQDRPIDELEGTFVLRKPCVGFVNGSAHTGARETLPGTLARYGRGKTDLEILAAEMRKLSFKALDLTHLKIVGRRSDRQLLVRLDGSLNVITLASIP